jgi:hypothetical protein
MSIWIILRHPPISVGDATARSSIRIQPFSPESWRDEDNQKTLRPVRKSSTIAEEPGDPIFG